MDFWYFGKISGGFHVGGCLRFGFCACWFDFGDFLPILVNFGICLVSCGFAVSMFCLLFWFAGLCDLFT